jgi:hypothetical protein
MRTLRLALLSLLASTSSGAACVGSVGSCIPGTPGCVCEASGTCDPESVCTDNRCVPLEDGPGVSADDSGSGDGGDGETGSSSGTIDDG